MKRLRIAFFALALLAPAALPEAAPGGSPATTCGKNHYLLEEPCEEAWGWSYASEMRIPRTYHAATLLPDGRVLVTGGIVGEFGLRTRQAELFDPISGAWAHGGEMNLMRHGHSAVQLQSGEVLLVGGEQYLSTPSTGRTETYDAIRGWRWAGKLATPREAFTLTLLGDGRVLVAGGRIADGSAIASAEIYDPQTRAWNPTRPMRAARAKASAVRLADGRVLVAGGTCDAEAELFDPVTETWTAAGAMNHFPTHHHTASLLPDMSLLVVGGDFPDWLNECTPHQDGWGEVWSVLFTHADRYPSAGHAEDRPPRFLRGYHTATFLRNGELLVAGGSGHPRDTLPGGWDRQDSTELYSYVTGTWRDGARMSQARDSHTATLLQDGRVLVTGGEGDACCNEMFPKILGSAEIFGPGPRSGMGAARASR